MRGSSFLADLLQSVSDHGRTLLGHDHPQNLSGPGGPDALIDLCEALPSGRGEATGLAIARDILERYAELDQAERLNFFQALATRFGADQERFQEELAAWQSSHFETFTTPGFRYARMLMSTSPRTCTGSMLGSLST